MEKKIEGGIEVKRGRLLYMVYLKNTQDHYLCAGSLISEIHVLTVAYCIFRFLELEKYGGIIVVVRSISDLTDYTPHTVKHIDIHPFYSPGICFADIALITVSH